MVCISAWIERISSRFPFDLIRSDLVAAKHKARYVITNLLLPIIFYFVISIQFLRKKSSQTRT